jgi:hypothetical protein
MFNSENVCYYQVQNVSSSGLLSRNVMIEIEAYKTNILPHASYVCEICLLF